MERGFILMTRRTPITGKGSDKTGGYYPKK